MSCCYSTSIRSFSCLSPQTGLTQHHAQNDQSASMLHGFWVFTEESAQTLGLQQRQWNVTILISASQCLEEPLGPALLVWRLNNHKNAAGC